MLWDSKQRRIRQQAAAIKHLGPCSSVQHDVVVVGKHSKQTRWRKKACTVPTWNFQPVRLSSKHPGPDNPQSSDKLGQAVLSLAGVAGADVHICLPPSLSITATHSGGIDCRLQLLGVLAEWPGAKQHQQQPLLQPARSSAAGFIMRCGALLLAHALFPDHTSHLLARMAVPVALADAAAAVSSTIPPAVRQAVRQRASRAKHRLQRTGSISRGGLDSGCDVGWIDVSGGVLTGAMHTLRSLTGPAAAVAAGSWLWSLLHPTSHTLLSCMVALMAVSAEYQQLGREIAAGKHGSGRAVERLWHARHKSAAQRLAPYCGDLPTTPPLQHITRIATCCSLALGLAVDGQHWAGGLAGTDDGISNPGFQYGQQQLLLCGSCQVPSSSSETHKTQSPAGLSRTQLLELFTGTAEDDNIVTAAAEAAATEEQHTADGLAATRHQLVCCASASSSPCTELIPAGGLYDAVAPHPCSAAGSSTLQVRSSSATGMAAAADPAAGSSAADPLAFLNSLPLYGQQDHASMLASSFDAAAAAAAKPGVRQQAALVFRGVYLLLVFSPFFLLGVPMLLLATYLTTRAQQQRLDNNHKQGGNSKGTDSSSSSSSIVSSDHMGAASDAVVIISPPPDSSKHKAGLLPALGPAAAAAAIQQLGHPVALLQQLLQQLLLLLSMLCAVLDVSVVLLLGGRWTGGTDAWLSAGVWFRCRAWRLLLLSCRCAGAALIKWGQWSASRRDIFPADFCDTLAQLHDKAPVHGFSHTKREVESAFGVPLHQLFDSFDPAPLASGSIAQVHKATLRNSKVKAALAAARHQRQQQLGRWGARLFGRNPGSQAIPDEPIIEVIVKVAHPNVASQIAQDFRLLSGLSAAAARLPVLRGLSLRESVSQFSHTMTAQTDLRVEATHALRFYNNFKGVGSSVVIPRPLPGLVSPTVLVETFEAGRSVAAYMKETTAINTHIVGLGVDAFLKMLLVDNFVHTDLHPGNILFRAVPTGNKGGRLRKGSQQQQQSTGTGSGSDIAAIGAGAAAQLVLLDFGLAEELTAEVRHHFISFLTAISSGDGLAAARHLLSWSHTQTCPDRTAFTADVVGLFKLQCDIHSEAGIDLDAVMKAVLGLARKHHVSIDSCYASLVISVCVLVGFAKALDPGVNLMDAATPTLLAYATTGAVVGRLYST